MYPILFQWGTLVVPSWHAMFALAAIAAFFIANHLADKHKILLGRHLNRLFVSCYIAGYFGARIFAILVEEPPLTGVGDFFTRLMTFGPMTFYGGFMSAIAVGLIVCHLLRENSWRVADIALCAGMIALGIGRIGCFLNGDDYGLPVILSPEASTPWWAVSFPNHPDPLPRYPVQVIEALYVFGIGGLAYKCMLNAGRDIKAGSTALSLCGAYAVFRFFIEYWRGDFRGGTADGLTPSQYVSIAALICVNMLWIYRTRCSNVSHS